MTVIKNIFAENTHRLFAETQRIIALATDIGGWQLKSVRLKANSALIYFNVETGNKFPIALFHC